MLNKECIYIVGDKYKKFSELQNIYTYSEVLLLVKCNDSILTQKFIIIGQGVSAEERQTLRNLELNNKLGVILNRHYELTPQNMSHKEKAYNTMISAPRVIHSNKSYSAYLMLDDGCAEMSDHITGMHIQGMVIMEAARQMMLAVGEKYLLPPQMKGNAYFALKQINSKFYQFGFPIEVKLIHTINHLKRREEICIAETVTEVVQNGALIAEVGINYVACIKDSLLDKETSMACDAVQKGRRANVAEAAVDMCA